MTVVAAVGRGAVRHAAVPRDKTRDTAEASRGGATRHRAAAPQGNGQSLPLQGEVG